jgi:hypothetical protein
MRRRFALLWSAVFACGTLTPAADEDGTSDAGADAIAPEDARSDDASIDRRVPGGFCAKHPTAYVCSDFDDPTADIAVGWVRQVAPGSVPTASAQLVHGSGAAQSIIHVPTFASAADAPDARLVKPLPTNTKHVVFSFDLNVAATMPGNVSLGEIFWYCPSSGSDPYRGVWLFVDHGSFQVRVDDVVVSPLDPLPTGGFTTLVLDADWSGSAPKVEIKNGAASSSVAMSAPCADATNLEVHLGLLITSSTADANYVAQYDNALIELP